MKEKGRKKRVGENTVLYFEEFRMKPECGALVGTSNKQPMGKKGLLIKSPVKNDRVRGKPEPTQKP